MTEMTEKQKASAFWSLLIIVVVGNIVLLGALIRALFWDEGLHAEWLIAGFATEIVAGFTLAWKYYFQNSNKLAIYDNKVETQSEIKQQRSEGADCNKISKQLVRQVTLAGITKIIPARRYYPEFGSTLPEHVDSCRRSLIMVSINLMTGLPFENLLGMFKSLIHTNDKFSITISLLNPEREQLMNSLGASLGQDGDQLATSIKTTLNELVKFRKEQILPAESSRFCIRVHNTIPFGSAIIRDHETDKGSVQIETKVYKAPINSSFAIEFEAGSESGLYERLRDGYLDLIKDGEEWKLDPAVGKTA